MAELFSNLALGFGVAFTPINLLLCLIGGWILISIGVLGEYVAKIFEEVKRRPLYIVHKKVNLSDDKHE